MTKVKKEKTYRKLFFRERTYDANIFPLLSALRTSSPIFRSEALTCVFPSARVKKEFPGNAPTEGGEDSCCGATSCGGESAATAAAEICSGCALELLKTSQPTISNRFAFYRCIAPRRARWNAHNVRLKT